MGKFFEKPGPELAGRVPPGQHLAKGFPVLTYGQTPTIDPAHWSLRAWGLVQCDEANLAQIHSLGNEGLGNREVEPGQEEVVFSWSDVMAMPQHDFTADFHCVTTWSKLDVAWRGVKVLDLMLQVPLQPSATHVMLHCYGGYTTNLTLEDFLRPENFLAHTLMGEALTPEHGGPLRVVIPHLYAWKSAKWIQGLEFLPQKVLGFWEQNGYHERGEPFAQERYSR